MTTSLCVASNQASPSARTAITSVQLPPEVELYGRPYGREALIFDGAQEVEPLLAALGAAPNKRHGGNVGGAELDVLQFDSWLFGSLSQLGSWAVEWRTCVVWQPF